jgi:CubicO group peptidase (beta-lactamase class C family)
MKCAKIQLIIFKRNLEQQFMNPLMSILFILVLCIHCTVDQEIGTNNPVFSSNIENRIENVIVNLQVETAIENVFESKSLEEQMRNYNTPGVSIAVINDGKIEWARGFGKRDLEFNAPVDIITLFEAGSVSKPVFALAVMRLQEKGVLDLDKDVNDYLESWKIPRNGDWQPKISLRQLLSHTAGMTVHGFPGYLKSETIPSVPQILNGEKPANTAAVKVNILPGTTFRYSGGGTTIAQLAITDKTGKPFPETVKSEIFDPLDLTYSTYQQPLPEDLVSIASTAYPYKSQPIKGKYHTYPEMAAAGLWSNPSELAKILIEVQKALNGDSDLFSKETIEEILTPQKIADHIGIGFFLSGKGDSIRFGHGGWDEGFVTEITAYKTLGMGAVVMVNSNEGHALLGEIIRAIAIEYQWPDYIPERTSYLAMDQEEIKNYSGVYKDANENELNIETVADRLSLIYQNQDPIPLLKTNAGDYRNDHFNFSLSFKENEMQFNQQGKSLVYKKVPPGNH